MDYRELFVTILTGQAVLVVGAIIIALLIKSS